MKKIIKEKLGKIARYVWVGITFFFALGEPVDECYWWIQIINMLHFVVALTVSTYFDFEEGDDEEDYSDF